MLSGGGMYGYVYIGVYRFLQEYNLLQDIRFIYGTSIGACFGFIYGLNISYEKMESLFMTPKQYFNATEVISYSPDKLFDIYQHLGAYSTRPIMTPLITLLEETFNVSDITFQEYIKKTGKDLHINAVCVNTGEIIDFCNDLYPDMSILTAIQASICIPFLFRPIEYKNKLYIDGGTSNNLPLHWIPSLTAHKCLAINLNVELEEDSTLLKNNIILYSFNVLYTILKAAAIVELQMHPSIDTINISVQKIPIPPLELKKEEQTYKLNYPNECIEKAILYGYEQIYYFYTSRYSSSQS